MTQSLRRAYRKADLFLKQINYALRDNSVVFKLGKNMLWIEIHIINAEGDESMAGGEIEVCLSLPPQSSASVPSFIPDIQEYSISLHEAVFDEKEALRRMKSLSKHDQSQVANQVNKEKVIASEEAAANFNEEEVKMLEGGQA